MAERSNLEILVRFHHLLLVSTAIAPANEYSEAAIVGYDVVKTRLFSQTSAAQPTTPNSYNFQSRVFSDAAGADR